MTSPLEFHYLTYTKQRGSWWRMNDSRVKQVTFDTVKKEAERACVLLMYEICSGKNLQNIHTTQHLFRL
jgi:ubiquitin C-terminal hydrolase